jgi:flagellar biosynthetic protein FliO
MRNWASLLAGFRAWPKASLAMVVLGGVLLAIIAGVLVFDARQDTLASSALPQMGQGSGQSSGWPTAVDIGIKLLAVIALIYVAATLLKRYTLGLPKASQGIIHVLDASPIGPRRTIYVVEVGDRVLVIGGTDSSLTTLAEFTDPETVASLVSNATPGWGGFPKQLELSLRRSEAGAGTSPTALQQPIERLSQAVARLRGTGSSDLPRWGGRQ